MAECNSCGSCCDPVTFQGDVVVNGLVGDDRAFMEANFTEVDAEEAHRRRPWLSVKQLEECGFRFFNCAFFDPYTRQCTAYDARPNMCKNFPWYSRGPNPRSLNGLPYCSFWEDLPLADRRAMTTSGQTVVLPLPKLKKKIFDQYLAHG